MLKEDGSIPSTQISDELISTCFLPPTKIGSVTALYLFIASVIDLAWKTYNYIINMIYIMHMYICVCMCVLCKPEINPLTAIAAIWQHGFRNPHDLAKHVSLTIKQLHKG